MIVLVSSSAPERSALAALCQARGWLCSSCASVAELSRFLRRNAPRVAVVRQRPGDRTAADTIAALRAHAHGQDARLITLLSADTSSANEARLITLGADCTLRDPIRPEVLLAFLDRWATRSAQPAPSVAGGSGRRPLLLAGATLDPLRRTLKRGSTTVTITPREVELAEILARSSGEVVTYEMLYAEILQRPFDGETTNLRVLLGKLNASLRSVGLDPTRCVEVIAKVGYRLHRRPPRRSPAGSNLNRAA